VQTSFVSCRNRIVLALKDDATFKFETGFMQEFDSIIHMFLIPGVSATDSVHLKDLCLCQLSGSLATGQCCETSVYLS
jgi:hypothetical protein